MNDFLSWIEGAQEKYEADKYFSMYQTSLLFNSLRNQWGDNGTVTVEELLGKKKPEMKLSLSDFASKEQFDEYMRQLKERQGGGEDS